MNSAAHGLPATEVESLMRRLLQGEPGIAMRPLRRGHGFLCHGAFGQEGAVPWLFAVATEGGVLLRLPTEARERAIDNGIGTGNAALPDWVLAVDAPFVHEDGVESVHGEPSDWLWVPIADAQTFERRRPHVHEALEYGRHARSRET